MTTKDYIKCVVSVIIALIMSLFLTSDVTSDMIMGLIGGNSDFEVSDFYNRVDTSQDEKKINNDIIVVNIDDVIARDSLASIIDRIAADNPAVIGVDILFRVPKEGVGDSLLIDVFNKHKDKIVAAIALSGNGEKDFTYIDESIFLEHNSAKVLGVVNLAACPGGIVRSFMPYFHTSSEILPSFATSVASHYSTNVADKIIAIGTDEMKLRYSNEKFLCLSPESLYGGEYDLKNKVILVGTLSDPTDMHPTPIEPAYPGVLIQAEIISTMLTESYISTADDLLNKSIAILISFLLCVIYVRYDNNNAQNLILRLLLMAVVAIGIIIGCVLYCSFNIYINITMILLVIALSQFVLDIWYGVEEIISRFNKSKCHSNRKTAVLVLLLSSFGCVFPASAEDTYTVYDLKGTVTRLNSGQPLSKGAKIENKEMLGMEKNRELILADRSIGKLYVSKSQKNTTAEDIIKAAKSQSKSLMKRMYAEMLTNIKHQDNRKNASSGANLGAVFRDDSEELNINTEYIFSFLSALLSSTEVVKKTNTESKTTVFLTTHEISKDIIWWSIRNDSPVPLFVNILQLSDGNTPAFIYESDVEMPSLVIAPGKELDLSDQFFIPSHGKYFLIASEIPFDSQDINAFFANRENPIPLNELNVKESQVFILPILF